MKKLQQTRTSKQQKKLHASCDCATWAGLVVIDFIDMHSNKNQREVENRLKSALEMDRARVQVGRISRFGLMEMSRQRLRPSLGETAGHVCPRCSGTGIIRDLQSLALSILRLIEEEAAKENTGQIRAEVPVSVGTFLLNEKREIIADIEKRHNSRILILPNPHMDTPHYEVTRLRPDDTLIGQASYEQTFEPETDFGLDLDVKESTPRQDAAVKAVNAPARTPAPQQSLIQKVTSALSSLFTPEEPAQKKPSEDKNKRNNKKQSRNGRDQQSKRNNSDRNQNARRSDKQDRNQDRQDRNKDKNPQRKSQDNRGEQRNDSRNKNRQNNRKDSNERGRNRSERNDAPKASGKPQQAASQDAQDENMEKAPRRPRSNGQRRRNRNERNNRPAEVKDNTAETAPAADTAKEKAPRAPIEKQEKVETPASSHKNQPVQQEEVANQQPQKTETPVAIKQEEGKAEASAPAPKVAASEPKQDASPTEASPVKQEKAEAPKAKPEPVKAKAAETETSEESAAPRRRRRTTSRAANDPRNRKAQSDATEAETSE